MTKLKSTPNLAGLGIVPEELTEDNYETWKLCLKNYLVGNGLWGVASGRESEPNKQNKQEHEEWKRKNALALHAIQLSCGPAIYSKLKESHNSAYSAWRHLAERAWGPMQRTATILDQDEESHVEDNGSTEYLDYAPLYKAIEHGNWPDIENFLKEKPEGINARISSHKDTALHIATLSGHIEIAQKLVSRMEEDDLGKINEYGATALSLAAICGAKNLAKTMVCKSPKLVTITSADHEDGQLPVIVAALYGQKDMARYLYRVTPKHEFAPEKGENGATLLNCLITAEIYDVACMLLRKYPKLGVTPDHNGNYTLRILAHKPSAFPSVIELAFWERCIYNCVPVHSTSYGRHGSHDNDHHEMLTSSTSKDRNIEISENDHHEMLTSSTSEDHNIEIGESSDEDVTTYEQVTMTTRALQLLKKIGWWILQRLVLEIDYIYNRKLVHEDGMKLLRVVSEQVRQLSKLELNKMDIDKIIHDAIKHGIVEIIQQLIEHKPEIIWRKDKKGRTIFSHAIVLRQEKIFSLIYTFGTKASIMARRHDIFKNNFLHLAAKLSPPPQLQKSSGAALQMQRELQWFKEVEKLVQPRLKEEANEDLKTPGKLFSEEHKELAKDAETWMKSTAGSSMIVGTLIAAVMFTTAFTVPGGNDQTSGMPILLEKQKVIFLIFMVSNALSLFSSTTSLLMFLGILTARYAEQDYFKLLPTKLILGLTSLFFSIVTMMMSFGSSIYLILREQMHWITIPIIIFSVIPIVIFSVLQFPLLIEMTIQTHIRGIFDKPTNKNLRSLGKVWLLG